MMRIFVDKSPVLRTVKPSNAGLWWPGALGHYFWVSRTRSAHERSKGGKSTHFNNVAIRIECRVTIQFHDHSLDHRGELSRRVLISVSLVWHLWFIVRRKCYAQAFKHGPPIAFLRFWTPMQGSPLQFRNLPQAESLPYFATVDQILYGSRTPSMCVSSGKRK